MDISIYKSFKDSLKNKYIFWMLNSLHYNIKKDFFLLIRLIYMLY